ncbi:HXXXD-type acyl-transferase family protein [Rhynchospora pubera]|uniref:HXXXD-type acyl-transferase family protein n=1 Tax=Rhynchospora pubera TaxID=906938 RepID=A0AAV8FPJ8_9POAL|nr:HXXXD-type acyl-transferase family protein [Rhynchospora pubera]
MTVSVETRRSRVTVYAKSTAPSLTPVKPGKTHEFTALDHSMSRHSVHLVCYYRQAPTVTMTALKESLCDVLSYYPAMTGRLVKNEGDGCGEWMVKCNDAGVRMVDARADTTLDEFLATATDEEERQLAYWEDVGSDPYLWSPYCIQFTDFKDGSMAVGISCTHFHADPTCVAVFSRAWSETHRRALVTCPPFFHPWAFYPRKNPVPSSPHLSEKSTIPPPLHPPAMSSVTFAFSASSVRQCLADLQLSNLSPFDALASLLWLRISSYKRASLGTAQLTLAVDCRRRMSAPLPLGFYGNALHFFGVKADLSSGWIHIASELNRHVSGIKEDDVWSSVEWLHERSKEKAFQMYGPELTCLAWDNVPVYNAEFSPGAIPVHVGCRIGNAQGEGLVVIMAGAPGEGEEARTVIVTLPTDLTAQIYRDEAILKYRPKIMFSPNI